MMVATIKQNTNLKGYIHQCSYTLAISSAVFSINQNVMCFVIERNDRIAREMPCPQRALRNLSKLETNLTANPNSNRSAPDATCLECLQLPLAGFEAPYPLDQIETIAQPLPLPVKLFIRRPAADFQGPK